MEENFENNQRPLAVITGASSGIGYELAKVFGTNGFDLLVCAEDPSIADAANAFRDTGATVEYLQTDLATTRGTDMFYDKIVSMSRPVEALCVNAGVGVSGEFAENRLEDELNIVNLNIISVLQLTKKVLKDMLSTGHGRILFTSSIAAEMPGPYYAVYAASKAFIQSFAEALRYEVKDRGITITALQPGATDTEFFVRAGMMDTKAGQAKKDDPADVAKDGFEALMAGKDHVVAGSFMNKVQVGIGKLISEQAGAKVHARDTKPGTAH